MSDADEVAVALDRVLRQHQAEARADEHAMLGRVIIPPPDGCEAQSLDEQFADPEVRRRFHLDDPDWR